MDYQKLLLDHLELIDRVVHYVARRHHLPAAYTDEFSSVVRFRLIDKDFAVLRKFQGRSSMATYLTTVIERLYLDFCIAQWGKWRPSAVARRLGPIAILLEQIVVRDGLSFDEAVGVLQTNHRVQLTRAELHDFLAQLPARAARRPAGEEELELIASRGGALDPAFDEPDDLLLVRRIEAALAGALATLPARDRLLLKMRYLDDLPAPAIGRVLGMEAKPLYRRLEQILRSLRTELHRSAITETDIARIVGHPAATLGRILRETGGSDDAGPRPSNG